MLRTHELFRMSYLDLNKDNFVTGAILRGTSSAFLCTSLDQSVQGLGISLVFRFLACIPQIKFHNYLICKEYFIVVKN